MEEIQFENQLLTFEYYTGEIEDIEPEKLYYSRHLLDENLIAEVKLAHKCVLKVSSKSLDEKVEGDIYFVGIYSEPRYLFDNHLLIIYFETAILAINRRTLKPIWIHNDFCDITTIKKYREDLFIYDELSLARIDKQGSIKWRFYGSDHFVSYIGTENFVFHDDFIKMVDSNEVVYRISYDGEDIDNINSRYFNDIVSIEKVREENIIQRLIKKFR